MITKTVTMEYAPRATYGSTAYDLNRVRREAQEEDGGRQLREKEYARAKTRVRTRAAVKTAAAPAVGVSVFSVIGIVTAVVLITFVLLGYVQLAAISEDTSALREELAELTETQQQLTVAYESTFNLTEIERYATTQLGMTRVGADQITYLHTDKSDAAVIVDSGEQDGQSFLTGTVEFFQYLFSYFR